MLITFVILGLSHWALGTAPGPSEITFPPGDPRACGLLTKGTQRFEVLPGLGWDNLRNVEAGLLVSFNYSRCRTTEDGRFLVPDTVNTIPLKQSKVSLFSEFISHWTNYTSSTSKSVNIDVGLSFSSGSISGKFSSDYENVKSKQIGDKSYTTRVQLRYVRYTAKLQPDTQLHPTFKSRLLSIAGLLQLNHTAQARYESELLVRDFGTHVITSVDAGALLVQEDSISSKFLKEGKYTKSQITAGASASLFGILHFGASYSTASTKQFVDEYQKQRTSSEISTIGGPLLKAVNFTANDWTDQVDRDLVSVDRSGDPIFFFINAETLPELTRPLVYELYNTVHDAVKLYYEYNTYRGCTKMDSPNFSPISNLDDGTCSSPYTNLTFGGVYQTCSLSSSSNNGNLCVGKAQVNPKTGHLSCPQGYESVQLHSGHLTSSSTSHDCYRCWIFFHCCHDHNHRSDATYTMYWCAAKGPLPMDSGYLFGGLYTSKVNNPLTQSMSCPVHFYDRLLGEHLHVCISDDYELGMRYSVPFGGFVSCSMGNPLAIPSHGKKANANGGHNTLQGFLRSSGNWPKHCPQGYSQHLADVDQGCEINYCLQAGSLAGVSLATIRRPPFRPSPMVIPLKDNFVIFNPETNMWKKNMAALQYAKSSGDPDPLGSERMSPGTAAGITIGATIACIALTTVVIAVVKRRRKRAGQYRKLEDPLLPSHNTYGSTRDDNVSVQP